MSSENKPASAVILSLVGGVLMFLTGVIFWMFTYGFTGLGMMGGYGGMMGGYGGMMGGLQGMMGSFGFPFGLMMGFPLIGLVSGILVIVGAVMLDAHPAEHTGWGTVILVFSIISFLGMGGFLVGAILGVIGGAFAISWRPPSKM